MFVETSLSSSYLKNNFLSSILLRERFSKDKKLKNLYGEEFLLNEESCGEKFTSTTN